MQVERVIQVDINYNDRLLAEHESPEAIRENML